MGWGSIRRTGLLLLVVVLVAACAPGEPEPDPADEVATGVGVTAEPCPDATDEERGCIYLGVLADLTGGPFGPLGVEVVSGVRDFWTHVNQRGGVGGFDVDVDTFTRDTAYDARAHLDAYAQVEPGVLALALSFGTPTTEALAPELAADGVVAVPFSWWSGLDQPPASELLLRSGASYCAATQLALGWLATDGDTPDSVMVVGFPGAYGDDAARGARTWAEAAGADYLGAVDTEPNATIGSQQAALEPILEEEPDVVVAAIGPPEAADLVGAAAAQGYEGRVVGLVPTWDPSLLDTDAAPALEASFVHVAPWEGFEGDSAAHRAMRVAHGEGAPGNDGYTAGWMSSYPLLAALDAAFDAGALTRAGLRSVLDGLEVAYDGALPPRVLGAQTPDEVAGVVVSRPDPAAATGLMVLDDIRAEAGDTPDCAP